MIIKYVTCRSEVKAVLYCDEYISSLANIDGRPRESEKTLSKYLVTVVEKFLDNWATDEASGT